MRAASALSTHPIVATALGECAGQVLEALGGTRPALVLVAVTPPHLGTLEDVGAALRALLEPDVTVGAVAAAVVGAGRNVEGGPALSLFALSGVAVAPLLLEPDLKGGLRRHGHHDGTAAALVLADPFSCPTTSLVGAVQGLEVSGGLLAAAHGPGGSRLLLDGVVRTSGGVGALLGAPAKAVASQGGTPVGPTWVVTQADRDVVLELGGRPVLERRRDAVGDDARPRPVALGLLLDEHADRPGRSDLKAVRVLGPAHGGGLRVAEPIEVGRVVRFVLLGASEVEADLVSVLASSSSGRAATLLFPGTARGGDPDLVAELLGTTVAGMGVSAPLAPLAGVTTLHAEDATGLLLFP